MNVDELQRAHARRRDVTPEDVAAALASSDLNARRLGAIALYYTRMRQSVDALADVCFLHEYRDVGALNLLAQLAQIAENPYPVLVARKNTGLRMIAEGDLHGGVAAVESAVIDANHAAIKGDDRSRKAMALLHDVAIDDAYDAVGARFRSEAAPPPSNTPFRVHIVASALADNAATTRVIVALARHLSARGIDASILLTAHTSSGDSPAFAELAAVGIPVWTAPSGNPLDRALALARRGREDPAHAAVFYAWPMDAVAKLASVVGVAQSHVFVNHTAEQKCGRFEVIAQCTRDFSRSYRPELGRYLSPASVKFDLVEAAQPLDRARLGVRPDQILLGSYGRLSKCVEPIYITATSRILREAPETVLVLPGLPDPLSERDLRAAYAGEGVLDRVRFPGYFSDEYFKLLKSTDVYLDTFSWTGGQSVLDAMVAGLPIVASRPGFDPDFDPTGTAPISLGSTYLSPEVPVAPARDAAAYAAIALDYVRSAELRARHGAANRRQSAGYRVEKQMDLFEAMLTEAVGRYGPPPPRRG